MAKAFEKVYNNYTFCVSQEELSKIEVIAPLSAKQEKYLNDNESDIIIFGGCKAAGKSELAIMKLLISSIIDKDYTAVLLMSSLTNLKGSGGLWSKANKRFKRYGAKPNKISNEFNFPNGAQVKAHYLNNNTEDFYGMELHHAIIDEAQFTNESDVFLLLDRIRGASETKTKRQMLLGCNPLKTSWLCRWLSDAGYLDEEGYPLKDMDSVPVYMVRIGGELMFFKSREDIEKEHGKGFAQDAYCVTYYPANIQDNPAIMKHDPSYIRKLRNKPKAQMQAELYGCWYSSLQAEGYLKREWFNEITLSDIPVGLPTVRAVDVAATKPSDAYPDPDWTRSIKASYNKEDGNFYIFDMKSLRDRSAMVEQLIMKSAKEDGPEVYQCIDIDPGAAGKQVAEQRKARLMQQGSKVILNSTRGSKLKRAEPFMLACQEGKVFIVRGVFNEEHWNEIENFTGKRNAWHDDIIDALASCYNSLAFKRFVPSIPVNKDKKRSLRSLAGKTLL